MNIAIIGRSELLYNSIQNLLTEGHKIGFIITSKEAPEYKITSKHFESLAASINVPFYYIPKLNEDIIKEIILTHGSCDIGISVNYSSIIDENVIQQFPHGILNAHGGDLPRYRGNACQAWAILNGEDKIGLCVHSMIGGEMDSGNIIARDYFPLTDSTYLAEILNWLEMRIPHLFVEALNKLKDNPEYVLETQSKSEWDALRCYPRKPEDGLISWNQSNINIHRLIRASGTPYAGAYCFYKNKKLIIWKSDLVNDQENYLAVPGQVAKIHDNGSIDVITSEGKLKLIEIEYENKRTTLANEIITSHRDRLTSFIQ